MPTYGEAVCFCGPAPRVTAPGRYPAACSVEFGLSSDGSKSARDRLELFGVTIIALRTSEVNTGEQIDNDTHLVYLRARWYDPLAMNLRLGFFLARDPWSGDALRRDQVTSEM